MSQVFSFDNIHQEEGISNVPGTPQSSGLYGFTRKLMNFVSPSSAVPNVPSAGFLGSPVKSDRLFGGRTAASLSDIDSLEAGLSSVTIDASQTANCPHVRFLLSCHLI